MVDIIENPPEEKKEEVKPPVEKTEKELRDKAVIERMEAATAKLEEANKRFEQNKVIADAEKLDATLEGQGESGGVAQKKGLNDKEYADKVLSGEVPK